MEIWSHPGISWPPVPQRFEQIERWRKQWLLPRPLNRGSMVHYFPRSTLIKGSGTGLGSWMLTAAFQMGIQVEILIAINSIKSHYAASTRLSASLRRKSMRSPASNDGQHWMTSIRQPCWIDEISQQVLGSIITRRKAPLTIPDSFRQRCYLWRGSVPLPKGTRRSSLRVVMRLKNPDEFRAGRPFQSWQCDVISSLDRSCSIEPEC